MGYPKAITRGKGGFTLVEIMIVVLIIGILLAVAVPNFLKARENSRTKSCVANLKRICTAKEQWAIDFKKADGDTPTKANLTTEGAESGRYIKQWPECPSGGDYEAGINAIGTDPVCSLGGTHVLP